MVGVDQTLIVVLPAAAESELPLREGTVMKVTSLPKWISLFVRSRSDIRIRSS